MGARKGQTGDDVPYVDLGVDFNATAVASGEGDGDTHCVLSTTEAVLCWGGNVQGQLGVGDTDTRQSPVSPLVQIAITAAPTTLPTSDPTDGPTALPSLHPSNQPTVLPSANPTTPTAQPTPSPTYALPSTNPMTVVPTSSSPSPAVAGTASAEHTDIGIVTTWTTTEDAEQQVPESGATSSSDDGQQWTTIVFVLLVLFLVSTCVICVVGCKWYWAQRREMVRTEQNIAVVAAQGKPSPASLEAKTDIASLNIEMQSEQIEVAVADTVTIQAPTPTFDAQIEFEPSLQMGQNTVTAGRIQKASQTKGEDNEYAEKEEVADWLKNTVGLEAYFHNFWENGYGSLEYIKHIASAEDLVEIGIIDQEHQEQLMCHIQMLMAPQTEFI